MKQLQSSDFYCKSELTLDHNPANYKPC